jgi:small subunit ribosomal protein S6
MNYYENLLILDPNLDEKSTDTALEKVKDLIGKHGGEILKIDNWGRKKLAFELKKRTEGVYILLLFKAPPLKIVELEKSYKLFDFLVKFLIVKLSKKQREAALSKMSEEAEPASQQPAPEATEGDKNV